MLESFLGIFASVHYGFLTIPGGEELHYLTQIHLILETKFCDDLRINYFH